MLNSAMTTRDWLKQLESQRQNTRWLAQHEDELYAVIAGSLYRQSEFHDVVELLMMVFQHYALVLYHTQRWSPLLLQALLQAQDLRDNDMQISILTQMGETYLTLDKNEAAREAFGIALERAREGQTKEMVLATYIGLIRMQSVNLGDTYDPNLLAQALTFSQQIDDLSLKAALHQSLALAYIHSHETLIAIEHGQIAYVYWHHLNNNLELAKTLYLLSAAYRFAWRLERAEYLLRLASERFENTQYNRQYTVLAYEAGALYLQRKEYEAGLQWLTIALREAATLDSPYLITAATHALAIAQTGLAQYDQAEANLQQAIVRWEKLNNYYELASAYQALGNLKNKRGQPEQALLALQTALELCLKTPPTHQRTWLEGHIRDTIDEVV